MTTKRHITFSVPTYRLMGAIDACLQRLGSVTVNRELTTSFLLDVKCEESFANNAFVDDFCKRYASTIVESDVADGDDLDEQVSDLMQKVSKQPERIRQKVADTIMQYCTITTEVKPAESESDAFYTETDLEID